MGRFEDAIKIFVDMVKDKVLPTQFTLTNVLASCAATGSRGIGKKVHSFVVKLGLHACVPVANSLLNMYAKTGDLKMAKVVFDRMKLRNTSSWNAMISLHMNCGRVDLALAQFELLSERDIVSWNSMIAGCNQHGFDNEALQFFSSMLKDTSLKPDRFSLASALSACASLEKLSLGKQIHGYIVRTMFDASGAVGNALISMYAKSGGVEIARRIIEQSGISDLDVIAFTALLDGYVKLGDITPARQIFNSLKDPDVVAWTAMIVGFVQNGLNNDAIEVYKNVDLAKVAAERLLLIEPNNSGAYSALANVYSSCGKWDDAAKIRKLMKARGVKKEQGLSWVQIQNKTHVFGVEDGLHPQKDEIYKMMDKIWKEIKKMGFAPDTESVLHDLGVEILEMCVLFSVMKVRHKFTMASAGLSSSEMGLPYSGKLSIFHRGLSYPPFL
ncbi:hypothetical protein D5086_015143, partial [Populus alba]